MRKRRPRLVPKVVFRVAALASAIPMIALGCKHRDPGVDNPVACCGYGVAVRAYPTDPPPDAGATCPPGGALVRVGEGEDGGFACLAMGVAAIAYDRQPMGLDAAAKQDAPPPPPVKGVAARGYTR